MRKRFCGAVIAVTLALATVAALAIDERTAKPFEISISPIDTVPAPDGGPGMVTEFTVTLQQAGSDRIQRFVVQGHYRILDTDDVPRVEVVDDRLLVLNHRLMTVFDLKSGKQMLQHVGAPYVVGSADGKRVAFETLQLPFTPYEASSSVIQVLDVPRLTTEPVFPERELIEPAQFGRLTTTWIDEPFEVHSARQIFISPDGSQLAFFCYHSADVREPATDVFLVIVDLPEDLSHSHFTHQPFDWQAHLVPEAVTGKQRPYFAVESAIWTEAGDLLIKTPPSARWLEREFTVPLAPREPYAPPAPKTDEGGEQP